MIDWLLIGGNSHGIVVTKKNMRRLVSFGSLYKEEDYEHAGKRYRIGACHPTEAQRAEVPALIEKLRPRHV